MPNLNGIKAAREIRGHLPDTKIIALSAQADLRLVIKSFKAGAQGYVLKQSVVSPACPRNPHRDVRQDFC